MRKWRSIACAFAALALWAVAESPGPAQARDLAFVSSPRNPLFAAADPHLTAAAGRWWIYATSPSEEGRWGWSRLFAYSSPDLRTWTRSEPLISFSRIRWVNDDRAPVHFLWAPALAQANGRFYLYFSVGPQYPTPSRIGVATAETPAGPFTDTGAPLLVGGDGFEAIDPMVFIDPRSHVPYLYAGGSAGAKLRVYELKPNMVEIKRKVRIQQPPYYTEAPFMHERNGVYYLSYSHGHWNERDYSVLYATAPRPTGPWTFRGLLLKSDRQRGGPGHHSIAQNPATGEWFIAYHRWQQDNAGPFQGDRRVAVQRLTYEVDGSIVPVEMNNAPPPSSPLSPGAKHAAAGKR